MQVFVLFFIGSIYTYFSLCILSAIFLVLPFYALDTSWQLAGFVLSFHTASLSPQELAVKIKNIVVHI